MILVVNSKQKLQIPTWRYNNQVLTANLASHRAYLDSLNIPYTILSDINQFRNYPSNIDMLREYQQEAVKKITNSPYPGLLLFLTPGLGKGATSIVVGDCLGANRVLIICPKSLISTVWEVEIKKWALNPQYTVLSKRFNSLPDSRYVITSYDNYKLNQLIFNSVVYDLVIIDESLMIKNRNTQRFKAFKYLKAKFTLLLTGNPISKYYDDLWTQFNIIWPKLFGSYWRFTNTYCRIEKTVWANKIVGNRNVNPFEDYHELVFARNQEQVAKDIPDVLMRFYDVDLLPVQRKAHKELKEKFITELESGKELSVNARIATLTRLRQIVSGLENFDEVGSAKQNMILEMLEAGDVQFPILIFGEFVLSMTSLYEKLKTLGYNVGIAYGEKTEPIMDYMNGSLDVLILGLEIGKYGHNLERTKSVIYLDRNFSANTYFQSIHRVKRLTLQHSPTVTVLRAKNSIDDLVDSILTNKLTGIANLTQSELANQLKGIKL